MKTQVTEYEYNKIENSELPRENPDYRENKINID